MAQQMNGIMRGASGGISRLAAALGGGDLAEQQAQQKAMEQQSRIGLALSQMRAHDAQAGFEGAKTDALRSRPQIMRDLIAANSGVDGPSVDAFQQKLRTGELVTDFQPQEASRLTQALTRFAPLASNTGDIKADDWAKALGGFRNMDLGDQVLSGQRTPEAVAASQAAMDGRPLYHADSTGAVLDLYGGKLDTSNPMAGSTITLRKEQANQAKAGAVENYAQAAAARAHAAASGAAMSKPFEITGPDGPVLVQQDKHGNIRPVEGYTPKSGSSKPLTDAQAKALLFGTRMQEANKVLETLDYSPAAVNAKQMVEGMPLIGGIAGAVGNAMLSTGGQQAEQAQRDFINAVLRRESGAVISDGEFANAKRQYFPQPNDKPDTLLQKARNRQLAINGLLAEVPEAQRGSITPKASVAAPAAAPSTGGFKYLGKE